MRKFRSPCCLERFAAQINGRWEDQVEIIISDDCSPDDVLKSVRTVAETRPFMTYWRYETNLGLERNPIACTESCVGEYLWIFGDDDLIAPEDGVSQVMNLLLGVALHFAVLNRTRRSFSLKTLSSDNWMKLHAGNRHFDGLREFACKHGFISVVGFISVNVFRRPVEPHPAAGA